jgi:hypothetical protein
LLILSAVATKSTRSAQLLGTTEQEKFLVDQWLSFGMSELHPNAVTVMLLTGGYIPYFKPVR